MIFTAWIARIALLAAVAGCSGNAPEPTINQSTEASEVSPTAPSRPTNWAEPVTLNGVPNLHKVSDALYRSAQPTGVGMKNLKEKLGIKTIVNLRSFNSDRDELGQTGLGYEHITMKTWHPEKKEVVRFLQIVADPKRQPVLVHCQHGADRTGTMCAIYRIAVQDWSKDEAIQEMREGGYGFHKVWSNLPKWIDSLDIEKIKQNAGMDNEEGKPRINADG
ncbi:MAG: dual specificity protein phosphatase family protein [Pirellulales bacterium]|nr:dual specificity protein phosphatase family protein [Pirellulales bacterium]